jgi:light-regulated signal transduction histidine kinase (bacteriophytochrome)
VITRFIPTDDDINKASLLSGRGYCGIRLADNGIGFREEFAEQIFHIFQRLHRKSEFEGTGIGLAVCKKVVANHEGSIDAAGSSGRGAVFNIILPLSRV